MTMEKKTTCVQRLESVLCDIYGKGLNSCEALADHPELKNEFDLAVYEFLMKDAFRTETASTLADNLREKFGSIEIGDYVHNAYLGLYSKIKKGANKTKVRLDADFFHFNVAGFIPRLRTYVYNNILRDTLKRPKPPVSLDETVDNEDGNSIPLYELVPGDVNVEEEVIFGECLVNRVNDVTVKFASNPDDYVAYAMREACGGRLNFADKEEMLIAWVMLPPKESLTKAYSVLSNRDAASLPKGVKFTNLDRLEKYHDMPSERVKHEISRAASRATSRLAKSSLAA